MAKYKVLKWERRVSEKTSEAQSEGEVYLTGNGKLLGALEEGCDRVRAEELGLHGVLTQEKERAEGGL